jgi:hypothetical protein
MESVEVRSVARITTGEDDEHFTGALTRGTKKSHNILNWLAVLF